MITYQSKHSKQVWWLGLWLGKLAGQRGREEERKPYSQSNGQARQDHLVAMELPWVVILFQSSDWAGANLGAVPFRAGGLFLLKIQNVPPPGQIRVLALPEFKVNRGPNGDEDSPRNGQSIVKQQGNLLGKVQSGALKKGRNWLASYDQDFIIGSYLLKASMRPKMNTMRPAIEAPHSHRV